MDRRVTVALLVVIVALAGCVTLSATGSPLLTVDNEDDTEYRLAVYVLPDLDDPDTLTFRATNAAGDRRSAGMTELRDDGPYRNVSLAVEDAESRRLTIRAGTTTSAAINLWTPGDATVYVVETVDRNASLVGVYAITCGVRDQEHGMTITNGTISGRSATCP